MRYESHSRRLVVIFQSGRVYAYRDVPAAQYERFMAAGSKGSFFNRHVRDAYACERLADEAGA